jgi:glycosyltransferase involved in cell wall biosynthesis
LKPASPFDVVITCNYSPWSRYKGGAQKSVHMLASAMAADGKRVCVVYSKAPWEKVPLPAELPYEVRWAFFFGIRPGVSSPLRWLNGLTFLRTVRAHCGPDTLIIGNGDEAGLLWRIRERRLFVFGSRNTYDDFLIDSDWTRAATWLRIFFKEPRYLAVALAARNADVAACTSGFSLAQLRKCFGIPEERTAVIHNGLDPLFFDAAFRESGQRGVLFFGRLAANKGAHHALEAFLKLPPELRRAHPLLFAGDGPLKERLERMARDAGAQGEVTFRDWMPGRKLAEAIVSCRLVLLPSLEESFGNAILETLATGQNLISTNACAIPEVAGPYGTLVAPGDVDAMAEALARELARIRSEAEIAEQQRYFRDRFTWPASGRRYLELEGPTASEPAAVPASPSHP